MVMEKIMVFFRRVVGPDQGRYHTREKGDGKFTKKIDAFFTIGVSLDILLISKGHLTRGGPGCQYHPFPRRE